MRRWLKRHGLPATLALSALALAAVYGVLLARAGDGGVALADLAGDRSALEGFTLTGALGDESFYHWFSIRDGGPAQMRFVREPVSRYAMERWRENGFAAHDGQRHRVFFKSYIPDGARVVRDTEVEEAGGVRVEAGRFLADAADCYAGLEITPEEGGPIRSIYLKTRVTARRGQPEFQFEFYEEFQESGGYTASYGDNMSADYLDYDAPAWAHVAGCDYFTVPVREGCSGTLDVYRAGQFGDYPLPQDLTGLDVFLSANQVARGTAEPVVSVPLDGREVRMLGLLAAGDNLALALRLDGVVTVRLYRPADGALLDELELPGLEVPAEAQVEFSGAAGSGQFCLNVRRAGGGGEAAAVDARGGRLREGPRWRAGAGQTVLAMLQKGERMLVVTSEPDPAQQRLYPDEELFRAPLVLLHVARAEGEVYTGRLESPAAQDAVRQLRRQARRRTGDVGYRGFIGLEIT